MSNIRVPQNPGIDFDSILTPTETLTLQNLTAIGNPTVVDKLLYKKLDGTFGFVTLGSGLLFSSGTLSAVTSTGLVTTSIKTANYTAQPNDLIPCDLSIGSFTITLPSAPVDETVISIKLNVPFANRFVTVNCSGTDKFNTSTGNTSIYMYLFGEYIQMQYDAQTGIWNTFIGSATFNYATNFPGIDATTPISESNISINTTSRVLTITPPLGYFNIFVDGAGIINRYRKVGTINFPAFTDTSGMWYFYFDNTGTAVATQTQWDPSMFTSIVAVYRVLWNASLVGSAKLVAQYVEYHQNTVSAQEHAWMHLQGSMWATGGTMINNAITAGSPNADGRNSVMSLTTITNVDDNLAYTVANNISGSVWTQDMGNTTPASLNATNGGQFKVFTQDAGGLVSFLPATRFPFAWNSSTNRAEYITSTGIRTSVTDTDFMVYFVYGTQNPISGEALKVVSAPAQYTSIANARAVTWTDIQNTYPIIGNDNELRPLYRLIFEVRNAYNVGAKQAVLRETQDLRKAAVTSTTAATGSIPASSVTVVPMGNISSTNVQSALQEIDTIKAPLRPVTEKITLVDTDEITGNDSANTFSQIRTTWTNGKAFLKTYFDTLYAKIGLITASGLTISTNGKVLGRVTAGAGAVEEISYSSASTASTIVQRDTNKNILGNNIIGDYTTTATAAGTTTLVVGSTYQQYFTGATTQTVVLPVATTLANGMSWFIVNNSTGIVTINTSGANLLFSLPAGGTIVVTCINTAGGTGTASWSINYGVGRATIDTFTNKRNTKRVVSTTQSATPTINTDNGDIFEIVGLAQAITSMTTNLTGTPVEGDMMEIVFKDNATARAITWGASFVSSTATLPTTTVISTPLAVLLQYRTSAVWTATSAWYCLAVA